MTTALCAALALSACGGGGGGGSTVVPFTSVSDLPDNGTVVINGSGVTASYTSDLGTGVTSISAPTTSDDATTRIRIVNGVAQDFSVSAPGSSAAFDLGTAVGGNLAGERFLVLSQDGQTAYISENVMPVYEYQTYGTWITGLGTGSGTVGVGSFGAETNATALPANATYTGTGTGYALDDADQSFITDFEVSATTDFSTITITSSNTVTENLVTADVVADPAYDFTGSGPVSGNGFTASIASTNTSGTATGSFFGPNAEEFGGTFDTSGPSGHVHIGSFGGQ
ncbi:MAG: transferrin-binding protein-like solute binding protein [Pseudomonadota bacterium]